MVKPLWRRRESICLPLTPWVSNWDWQLCGPLHLQRPFIFPHTMSSLPQELDTENSLRWQLWQSMVDFLIICLKSKQGNFQLQGYRTPPGKCRYPSRLVAALQFLRTSPCEAYKTMWKEESTIVFWKVSPLGGWINIHWVMGLSSPLDTSLRSLIAELTASERIGAVQR